MNEDNQPTPSPASGPGSIQPSPEANEQKKSHKGLIIGLSILLFLGIGVAIGYFISYSQKNSSTQAQATPSPEAESKVTNLKPADVTAKIKADYASRYTLVDLNANNKTKTGEMSYSMSDYAPPYKTTGYNYYTDSADGSSIILMPNGGDFSINSMPRAVDTAVRNEIISTYKALGLTKAETPPNTDIGYVYTGRGIVCTIETPTEATSSNTASCGGIDSYKVVAGQVQPFVKLLPASDTNNESLFGDLKITDSQVSGYQRASMTTTSVRGPGGANALYYKSPTGEWKYFESASSILPCSQYNTADIRNSFKGEACYNNGSAQESTVK